MLLPIFEGAQHKPVFSSSTLLFVGSFVKDILQLVVIFLIEDKIKSDDPMGRISRSAIINLIFAIFDILHRLAEACDLLFDVHNTGYGYKQWIKAHNRVVSLALAGRNWISGASLDMTVKIWGLNKGKFKCIKTFKCESGICDSVAIGMSKVMVTCQDKKLCVFDIETGDLLGTPIELAFEPSFISSSHDLTSVYTSGGKASPILNFNIETKAPLLTYSQGANALAFFDDDMFVSSTCFSTNGFVWNVGNSNHIQEIRLEHEDGHKVVTMSPTMFLIGDGSLIRSYELDDDDKWTCNSTTFKGHSTQIKSLTKVNESLFVSISFYEVKHWDITKDLPCVFLFLGLSDFIHSSVFLEEEKAVATGD